MDARRELLCFTLAGSLATLSGCDRSGGLDDCRAAATQSTPGAGVGLCPESVFEIKDPSYRYLAGKLYSGENVVPDAVVRMDPSAGWPGDVTTSATITTDLGGSFSMRVEAPLHYDLTAVIGGDVITARALRFRYFEPTIDAPFPAFGQATSLDLSAKVDVAYRSRFDVTLAAPLPAGQKLAFFATGTDAIAVTGDLEQGLTLVGARYQTAASLYAIAYDGTGDLATATAFARVDVVGVANGKDTIRLVFEPFLHAYDLTIDAKLPPGFTITSADVLVAYSRSSRAYVTTLVPGVTKRVTNLIDTGEKYLAYRLIARTPDGRELDSGINGFGLANLEGKYDIDVDLSSFEAPVQLAPLAGAVVGLDANLEATGAGALEHVLAPTSGTGPTLHITTTAGPTTLPPLAALSTTLPRGAYAWTTISYPRLQTADQLSGRDARRFQAALRTPSRPIVFP